MNRYIKILFILLGLLVTTSCEYSMNANENISDDQLIIDIIDAEKTDINLAQLPAHSRIAIYQDYIDYTEIDAKLAAGLGYEVSIGGKGYKIGKQTEIYFNIEGRKLQSKRNKKGKNGGDNDGQDCFELVLPVTFVMFDSTLIIIQVKEDWKKLKDWYEVNLEIKERLVIQYPFELTLKETNVTINGDEELKNIYRRCSRKDYKKNDLDCFTFVYPVTLVIRDGSNILIEDSRDWTKLKEWEIANPNSAKPVFLYPIVITYRDSTIHMINNDEEMKSAEENCRD